MTTTKPKDHHLSYLKKNETTKFISSNGDFVSIEINFLTIY